MNSQNNNWVSKLKVKTSELRETGQDVEENPTIEVGLLMDCTSSMSSWIVKAKETLVQIINKVVEECNSEGNLKVRVSFIGYRDINDNRFSVLPFTEDVDAVKAFIQKVKAEGGADTPEDLQGGLQVCLHQDWTEEAAKRVFMIMDAPCHGKKYHDCDESYPEGSPEGLVLEDLLKEFCKKEIEFTVIKLDRNCDKMIQIMQECHQELEVRDMTTMQPEYQSYSYPKELYASAMPDYEEDEGLGYKAFAGCEMAMPMIDEGLAIYEDLVSYECATIDSAKDYVQEEKMELAECNAELDDFIEEAVVEKKKSKGLFSSLFGSKSKKSKAKAAPEMMMVKKSKASPMLADSIMPMKEELTVNKGSLKMKKAAPMQMMCAAPSAPPQNFEMQQQMAYQSGAIEDITSQFKRKQAAYKSKKSSKI